MDSKFIYLEKNNKNMSSNFIIAQNKENMGHKVQHLPSFAPDGIGLPKCISALAALSLFSYCCCFNSL